MMNHWGPRSLGKSDELFDFLKPNPKGGSVYDVFKAATPSGPSAARASGNFLDFFKPAQKRREESLLPALPASDGDPFAAAAGRPKGRAAGEDWKPYPRMREGYRVPAIMSGPGTPVATPLLNNPAFWLIAGVGLLIALEANGVTKLSSNA